MFGHLLNLLFSILCVLMLCLYLIPLGVWVRILNLIVYVPAPSFLTFLLKDIICKNMIKKKVSSFCLTLTEY